MRFSNKKQPKLAVIGAGVSGLTTAITLLEYGYDHVKIIADQQHPQITSSVAAAVWVPYKVEPAIKAKKWCRDSLTKFTHLAACIDTGVSWINCIQLYRAAKVKPDWMEIIETLPLPENFPQSIYSEYKTITNIEIPLIDTSIYMQWLMNRFIQLGGSYIAKKILHWNELQADADLIFNCTGLGARELVEDKHLNSVSGEIIICELPEDLDYAIACDEDVNTLTYVVPRKQSNTCIVGGSAIDDDETLEINTENINKIWQRALQLCPSLRTVAKKPKHFFKGYRPCRDQVRLEIDDKIYPHQKVVHNYGHGGGGFAISWGCALEALELANSILE
ncbi:MAG: FAD-dependent oxidoreductase [Pseudomonadota bacterium]